MLKFKVALSVLAFFMLLVSCAKKDEVDPITGKKKRYNINIDQKTDIANEKDSLFGSMTNKETTFKFSSSNVLWRASLSALDFIPLNNVDYSGGVIVSDWYSPDNSEESVKIIVRFLSDELKPSSVKVQSYKKNCIKDNRCTTKKSNSNFDEKIKEQILLLARKINIEDEAKK